jgi:hypothetical protein
MAGLEDAVGALGANDEAVGFSEGCGQGLFDQQVEAGIEQRGGYVVVMDGGNGNAGRVDFDVGGEQLVYG